MDSAKSTLLKDLKDSLLDGSQLSLDTPCKDSENSDSMKSSRMSTEELLEKKLTNTKLSVS